MVIALSGLRFKWVAHLETGVPQRKRGKRVVGVTTFLYPRKKQNKLVIAEI